MVLLNLKTKAGITGAFWVLCIWLTDRAAELFPLMAIIVKILASLSMFGTFVSTADENFFVGQCRFFSFCKRMLHKNRKTNNSLNETFTRDCF